MQCKGKVKTKNDRNNGTKRGNKNIKAMLILLYLKSKETMNYNPV